MFADERSNPTKRGTCVKVLSLVLCAFLIGVLPSMVPVHADSPVQVLRVTRSPGTPAHVASKPIKGPLPLNTYYAYVQWETSDNDSVTSSAYGAGNVDCVDTGESPCFSLQLTTSYCTAGTCSQIGCTCGGYQWVFFIDHGQDIVACVTGNTGCTSTNECSWGSSWPADDFASDEFYISFSNYYSYGMTVYNSANGYSTCTFGSGSLTTGLVSWEVSTGVGEETVSGSYNTCAVWNTSNTETWSVSGYAPSGVTMTSTDSTPATCTDSLDNNYNGGSYIWFTSGDVHGSTGEASNLSTWSWTSSSAQNFQYTIAN